jgi:hypothetical protein
LLPLLMLMLLLLMMIGLGVCKRAQACRCCYTQRSPAFSVLSDASMT